MPFNVKFTSHFDEVMKKHETGARAITDIEQLFSDEFVSHNTDFKTFDEMLDAGGLDKAEDLSGEVWSRFVAAHSRFSGFNEMFETAAAELYRRKTGF
jgi:hypothetical protein